MATLKPEHAQKLLNWNLKNLIKKVEAGKTLTNSELAIVQGQLDEGEEGAAAKGWAFNQVELAEALGVDRKTIQRWIKLKSGGPPSAESDGRYNVVEWKAWCKRTGRGGGVDGDEEVSEVERLNAKYLILRNRRMELEISEREGELISRSEVVADVSQAVVAFKRELYRMAGTIAPQIAGLPIPEIEIRIRDAVDDALLQLNSGKWDGEEKQQ